MNVSNSSLRLVVLAMLSSQILAGCTISSSGGPSGATPDGIFDNVGNGPGPFGDGGKTPTAADCVWKGKGLAHAIKTGDAGCVVEALESGEDPNKIIASHPFKDKTMLPLEY